MTARDSTNLREMQAVHELVKMADAVAYPAEYLRYAPFWRVSLGGCSR
jgi:hypothetical protein